jgi:hypothetical protein
MNFDRTELFAELDAIRVESGRGQGKSFALLDAALAVAEPTPAPIRKKPRPAKDAYVGPPGSASYLLAARRAAQEASA